ncbi:MAG: DUF423 domain-containing protein [Agarilytica sp.]
MVRLNERFFLQCAALSGMAAVIVGAFGAHALKAQLTPSLMQAYQTGVHYQFFHTFALLSVGILLERRGAIRLLKWSGVCFALGILLFSGSLYLLALSGIRLFGMVTPFGGLLFIVAWFLMWLAVVKHRE